MGFFKFSNKTNEGGQIGGQIEDLTERQKEVLKIIADNPKATRKKIAYHYACNKK
jgi:DNA-binding CsgD family transcriptional regulator